MSLPHLSQARADPETMNYNNDWFLSGRGTRSQRHKHSVSSSVSPPSSGETGNYSRDSALPKMSSSGFSTSGNGSQVKGEYFGPRIYNYLFL